MWDCHARENESFFQPLKQPTLQFLMKPSLKIDTEASFNAASVFSSLSPLHSAFTRTVVVKLRIQLIQLRLRNAKVSRLGSSGRRGALLGGPCWSSCRGSLLWGCIKSCLCRKRKRCPLLREPVKTLCHCHIWRNSQKVRALRHAGLLRSCIRCSHFPHCLPLSLRSLPERLLPPAELPDDS